ncbi:hypothetical protein HMPREF1544_00238 [Mucor circinelloides 1006PhL]|uniref:Uncharacterized protein n=1 Tax=Mucor circinelloides f. circinelloides (strain 1006PhL) TaxID=1220926 RepID=S2JS52_MUCC1|nr:hypothetical protein HMPREF1544_00238 [Mucor circinelloides 1006PhL]
MPTMEIDLNDFKQLFESVQALHKRLDAFEQAHAAQLALNAQLNADNNKLFSAITNLQKRLDSLESASAPGTTSAASAPTGIPAHPTQHQQAPTQHAPAQQPRAKASQWVQILQRPAAETLKRRREHAIRALQPPRPAIDSPTYTVLHLHRAHRMSHVAYRATLAAIGIDSKRILDVTFPARNISTILIHIDYQDEILRLLNDGKISQAADFNPLDHKHIADPQFKNMAPPQLTRIAAALHTDHCIRTVRYIKKHTVAGVIKFFLSQKWIPVVTAQDLSSELLPRPAKRSVDPRSTVGQLLMQPAFADQLCQPVTHDAFGNVVDSTAMDITEEFHPDADDSDPEETQE